jgi:hypothetical protein
MKRLCTHSGHLTRKSLGGSNTERWENAYIEGYLSLALDVVKQVVYDGKKNHVLVTMIASENLLLGQGSTTDILRASCSSSWRRDHKH